MPLASPRQLFLLAFLACVAIMGGALYLEHVVGLEACPLCVVQRIFFILIGLTCLAGAIQGPACVGGVSTPCWCSCSLSAAGPRPPARYGCRPFRWTNCRPACPASTT